MDIDPKGHFASRPDPDRTAPDGPTPDEFLERFLEGLEEIRDRFDWQLLPDSDREPDNRLDVRYRLRGIVPDGPARGHMFEPLGALCYATTGAVFTEDNWSGAAQALGIPSLCVAEIVAAANDHTWAGPDSQRQPVEHLRALRVRLLRAVGIRMRPTAVERVVEALLPGARQVQRR